MTRFNEFFKKKSHLKILPLLHTCDGYAFRDILHHNELKPSQCDVYKGEELLYLFYGRPSYRTSKDGYSVSHPAFMPVVIMLSPDAVENPKRIAPFDTGAFHAKLFKEHFHPHMLCDDFLLEPKMDMPGRLVSKFYGTNKNYFHSNPRTIKIPPLQFEAASYYSLIKSQEITSYDDRKESIEIQIDKEIILDKENVKLLILPNVFLDDTELRRVIIYEWKCEFRTYPIHHGSPNEYIGFLYKEVEEYLISNHYI